MLSRRVSRGESVRSRESGYVPGHAARFGNDMLIDKSLFDAGQSVPLEKSALAHFIKKMSDKFNKRCLIMAQLKPRCYSVDMFNECARVCLAH